MKQKLINSPTILTVAYWLNTQPRAMQTRAQVIPIYELERMANDEKK